MDNQKNNLEIDLLGENISGQTEFDIKYKAFEKAKAEMKAIQEMLANNPLSLDIPGVDFAPRFTAQEIKEQEGDKQREIEKKLSNSLLAEITLKDNFLYGLIESMQNFKYWSCKKNLNQQDGEIKEEMFNFKTQKEIINILMVLDREKGSKSIWDYSVNMDNNSYYTYDDVTKLSTRLVKIENEIFTLSFTFSNA